jgi:endoglucanase
MRMKIGSVLSVLGIVAACMGSLLATSNRAAFGAKPPTAAEINQKMATGFNLGNTFDSDQNPAEFEQIKPIIDLYRSAGIRHIRIPVTWMEGFKGDTLAEPSGQLKENHPRLKQLETVVDYCLKNGMVVVLNTHHERWLKNNYDGSPSYRDRFSRLWTGIANRFKTRSPDLIFEILNEPEGALGSWNGPVKPIDPVALARTREVNLIGYNAIRATGGANASRVIMVAPNGQGGQSMLAKAYPTPAELPGGGKDPYVMVTVHTYDPWAFCGENGTLDKRPTVDELRRPILAVAAHAKKLGVPVNYGEYGVGRNARPEERNTEAVRDYYRTIRDTTAEEGMSNTMWDDRGWFGLVKRTPEGRYEFVYNIVPSMMRSAHLTPTR